MMVEDEYDMLRRNGGAFASLTRENGGSGHEEYYRQQQDEDEVEEGVLGQLRQRR